MKIYIATKNENKIKLFCQVAEEVLSKNISVIGCSSKSEISETPWGDETRVGAKNRAINSLRENKNADLGIGIETGLVERYGHIYEETWCYVTDKNGGEFWGYASGNVVNNDIKKRIIKNDKDGTMSLEVFNERTQSFITYAGNLNIRTVCLSNAIKIALTQFIEKRDIGISK